MSPQSPAIPHTRSAALQLRAERYFPGGVNSPVRAFRAVGEGFRPQFVERAQGAWLTDADGNRYIDYFGSWGPMILGHAFPPVVEAIERAARKSASFGASTASEADLAEQLDSPATRELKRCALSQLGHGGHHVGHPAGARSHRAQDYRQV